MRNLLTTLMITAIVALTFSAMAQTPNWVKMMEDPTVNFYDVEKEFDDYFKNRDNGKGSGWKQFKRWKYFIEQRVYPHGERTQINPGIAWTEIQKFKKEYGDLKSGSRNTWTDLGPTTSAVVTGHWSPGVGRIDAIEIDPENSSIIYCGSPSGGLWKSSDAGNTWAVLTDQLPIIGISSIAIDPNNTDTIYIATGDKDASAVYSIGVLKSADGGITWNTTGLDWNITQYRTIHKLLIHPDSSNIIFAASSSGLFKTTNAGLNWINVLNEELEDIEFKPGNPDIVYGISNSNFYKSTNAGDSFTNVSVNISDRAQIAVTQANATYLYVVSAGSGIYRSVDSGTSFSYMGAFPDQGYVSWYAMAAAASHTNAEQLHVGEFETWVSNNGGANFTKTSEWTWGNSIGYVHCDIHEMIFKGGTLYCGSDGLITKSNNGGATWTNLTEGIGTRQFYRIGCSATHANKNIGGSQDNGTSVMTNGNWHEWLGADGMECIIDWSNKDIVYGTSQYGNFYKSNLGGNMGGVNIAQPGEGAWITPYVMDYSNPNIIYVGNDEVMKTTNGMMSWNSIGNFGTGNIDALAVAPSNSNYIYASKNEFIWMTNNGGTSWTEITGTLPMHYITYITVHPSDPQKVAISLSGYTTNEKVFVSDNAGTSWANFSGNLPNLPANCVVYHDDAQDGLYVGMDVGVFYRDNTFSNWLDFFTGLPNVIISELEIHYGTQKIRAGTYGRGLWEADLINAQPTAAFIIEFLSITGDDNGDGIPDPGETCNINVNASNYGNLASSAANVILSATGPNSSYITINTSQNNLGIINSAAFITSSHSISIDNQTPLETEIELTFVLSDGTISDELVKTIIVSELPALSMSNSDTSSCVGYFYDPGGEYAPYSNNEDYTMIIYPSEPNRNVEIDFTFFDIEYELNCDYDYLEIFDGTSVSDPLIGKYCGTNSPGFVAASGNDGALCFYFHADPYVTGPGWESSIACDPPLSISENLSYNRILIHSNPTTGILKLEINETDPGKIEISVLNSLGQVVKSICSSESNKGIIQIDISDQPSGIFYLNIKTPKGIFSKKVVLSK
ncbi:MAG: CUB domain-containing protein [Bacteroidota bacterium]|nr:CUB domain-containing protein [Bacteroidota bacterium]